ncbi:MAG: VCBS repeat-containing protein, partial [Planctomycetes bacterium]|nr:VCBS repeat-containing protein [Planctomycetota bacterium]
MPHRSIAVSALLASLLPSQQFADARAVHLPEPIRGPLAHHDWSGDGHVDLVYLDQANALRFAVNDTTGAFTSMPIALAGAAPDQPRVIALGDVDNDGLAEVYEALGNQLYRSSFNAALPPLVASVDFDCFAIEIEDLDGDGFGDVIAFSLGAVNVFWGGPSGIGPAARFAMQVWRGYANGDCDSAGDVDLVIPNGRPGLRSPENGGC